MDPLLHTDYWLRMTPSLVTEVWFGSTPWKGQKSKFVIKSRWEGAHLSPLGAFSASILAPLAFDTPLTAFFDKLNTVKDCSFSCGLFCCISGIYYASGRQTMRSCTVGHGVI